MPFKTMEQIGNCLYCNKKGEWLYFFDGFFKSGCKVLCEEHKNEIVDEEGL